MPFTFDENYGLETYITVPQTFHDIHFAFCKYCSSVHGEYSLNIQCIWLHFKLDVMRIGDINKQFLPLIESCMFLTQVIF